uniref:cDNA n=1 Tax=Macrostomum lignano TaxID=282301 RepID=A0A1I8F524_9PLAT
MEWVVMWAPPRSSPQGPPPPPRDNEWLQEGATTAKRRQGSSCSGSAQDRPEWGSSGPLQHPKWGDERSDCSQLPQAELGRVRQRDALRCSGVGRRPGSCRSRLSRPGQLPRPHGPPGPALLCLVASPGTMGQLRALGGRLRGVVNPSLHCLITLASLCCLGAAETSRSLTSSCSPESGAFSFCSVTSCKHKELLQKRFNIHGLWAESKDSPSKPPMFCNSLRSTNPELGASKIRSALQSAFGFKPMVPLRQDEWPDISVRAAPVLRQRPEPE